MGERPQAIGVEQADLQRGGHGGVTKAGPHLLPGFFADQALGVLPVVPLRRARRQRWLVGVERREPFAQLRPEERQVRLGW